MSSTATMNLALDGIDRGPRDACIDRRRDHRMLRIALPYGEQFRIPRVSQWFQVLSGTAWVSIGCKDHVLAGGDCLSVSKARDGAIVSALREEGIVFEIS